MLHRVILLSAMNVLLTTATGVFIKTLPNKGPADASYDLSV